MPQPNHNVPTLLQAAVIHHRAGRLDDARDLYERVLSIQPNSHHALNLLGLIMAGQGDVERGMQLIRRALAFFPGFPEALNNLGTLLSSSRRHEEALVSYDEAIVLRSDYAEAFYNRGVALDALDRSEEALASYDQAIALRPDLAEAFINRGNALKSLNRHAEALASYDRAIVLRPDYAETFNNRGVTLHSLHRDEEALASYDRAIALRPDLAEAFNNRGVTLHGLHRHEKALASYDEAIALRSDYAEAFNNRGNALKSLRRDKEALASYDRAIALRPNYAEALTNRGDALHRLHRDDEALASYDRAIAIQPDIAVAFNNRGVTLHSLNRDEEALTSYDRAIALRPDDAAAFNNRGVALHSLHRHEEALASYDRAIALQPDSTEALNNRGSTLHSLNRDEEALASYNRAIVLRPDDANAHFGKAACLLRTGDLPRGWMEYEWRWKMLALERDSKVFLEPLWLGAEPLAGRTILLHAEQGFGDTLQFCRYVLPVAALGARVVLETPRPLTRLLASLAGAAAIVARGDPLPPFDFHCPLMSLPLALGTTLATIPAMVPYLAADPARVMAWRGRLSTMPGQRVGLVWAGTPRLHDPDGQARRRSITLGHLAPLAAVSGVSFVSLQKGNAAAQTRSPPPGMHVYDFTDELDDFADTAALVAALDLVITVDTAVAHLAGALGKPLWILNRFGACWRWLVRREDSPWYPTARLFHQSSPGDWDGVIGRVCAALALSIHGERAQSAARTIDAPGDDGRRGADASPTNGAPPLLRTPLV